MNRFTQLLPIRVVPEPDEGVARVQEEPPEAHRNAVGVRKLEDEAPAAYAKLQRVRLRIWTSVGSPLDPEADDELVEEAVVAAEVERVV